MNAAARDVATGLLPIKPGDVYQCLDPGSRFIGNLVQVHKVTIDAVIYQVLKPEMKDWAIKTPRMYFDVNFIRAPLPALQRINRSCEACEEYP